MPWSSVSGFSDADFRGEIEMFGRLESRGFHIVRLVLGGHAAYRTQLFLYLKANRRDELNTFNLWGGVDGSILGSVLGLQLLRRQPALHV